MPDNISSFKRRLFRFSRKVAYAFLFATFIIVLVIFYCDWRVKKKSRPFLFSEVSELPINKVGLVLGTSKKNRFGGPNLYFENRISAAVKLFEAGKIEFIIVSGDNRFMNYNEPVDMKKELMKRGVPENVIFLDYAGFRTLDSVIRCKEIFGQISFTVISQKFHNERAVYLARKSGIEAVAFNADDVGKYGGFFTKFREKLARVKVFIDLYVINKQPHFLGESIIIE